MPPKSDTAAYLAFCAQEYHACATKAQQDAQQSAGAALPLPPAESWAVPPPPPAYGAPPSGADQAQASYYQPQQWPVPDSQPLGDQSSPWGPQTPWEADAWGFVAEVCGVDEACSSVSGFGCGSGSWGTTDHPIEVDSSSDEDEGALPHWNDLLYDGCVEAPVDKPSFQLCCLLLTLDYGRALHFEHQCRDRLGV